MCFAFLCFLIDCYSFVLRLYCFFAWFVRFSFVFLLLVFALLFVLRFLLFCNGLCRSFSVFKVCLMVCRVCVAFCNYFILCVHSFVFFFKCFVCFPIVSTFCFENFIVLYVFVLVLVDVLFCLWFFIVCV